eukprot:TRINITY_DN3361_c0_g1_i3.p1 TRINITY_DN3361_c0_g1~~TRINITY_DN3361_c0_g1_i3.p1  ORF type:complete len:480 (-),score=120.89 TRINITY_DN3361_c0_g1_i3:15-1286(-)
MSAGTGNDDTKIVMVDRRAKPGGHWNDAYDFVRLHQPSYSYGVSSMVLGSNDKDLCSKPQLLAYFELALKKMVETGRLVFLGQCEYQGEGRIVSLLDDGLEYEVSVKKKTVDATYLNTSVPSTNPPKYKISADISLVPINGLTRIQKAWKNYVVIGAGKTGIDAVLYLLDMNVAPDKIIWIMPNDSWLYNRAIAALENVVDYVRDLSLAVNESESFKEMVLKLEKHGFLLRLDETRWPTKFKCATVSIEEFNKLKEIKNIVRQGRVSEIHADKIIFEDGTSYTTSVSNLHVDCSADGLVTRPPAPIFQGKKIILQAVSQCQQVYSASVIAALEVRAEDNDEKRNAILKPIPHPEYIEDFMRAFIDTQENEQRNVKEGSGFLWSRNNRLGLLHHLPVVGIMRLVYWDNMLPVVPKLEAFINNMK